MADFETHIAAVIPGYVDFVSDFIGNLGEYVAGGVLIAFIIWTVAFVINSVFAWLDEWSR